MMFRRSLALLAAWLALASARAAEPDPRAQWAHWRGPLASGEAPLANPPRTWDEKTNVRWRTPIPGKASATPIVWGDRVFTVSAVDTGRPAGLADRPKPDPRFEKRTKAPTTYHQFLVYCLDRQSGKVLWKQVAAERVPHEGHHHTHSYAAGSPTTDGQRLYVSFGSFGVYCYDREGKLLWQRDLGRMHTRLGWGEASTPVIHGDTLVVNWDAEADSFLVALDARTGQDRWRVARDEVTSWATPAVVPHQGRTQVIVSATKRIRSYDLANGQLLWECGGMTTNVIPSPIVRDGVVYCLSGYGAAGLALPLDAQGDITGSDKILWKIDRGTPYVPSPVLVGDRLYFTQRNEPLLSCVDIKTGRTLIDRARLPGLTSLYASPVAAAGRIYFTGQDGTTVVIKQADRLEVLATNRLGVPIDASPALVGKQMFLRSHGEVIGLEEP